MTDAEASRPTIHVDDAVGVIVRELSTLLPVGHRLDRMRPLTHGLDLQVSDVLQKFWRECDVTVPMAPPGAHEPYFRPFYDAAWELCRMGVLRPGHPAPGNNGNVISFNGNGYAITAAGRDWVRTATERGWAPVHPDRYVDVLSQFEGLLGRVFLIRAVEASRCYWAQTYLACCSMAGTAAEAALIECMVRRTGDREAVLKNIRASGGRGRLLGDLLRNIPSSLGDRLKALFGVVLQWRDEAGHGLEVPISESQAHAALWQLVRLAQIIHADASTIFPRNSDL